MERKKIIKLINEVISEFDFLGNEEYLKEKENIDLMKNEDFQKQFICDSLLSIRDYKKTARNKKIKIRVAEAKIGGDWEEDFDDASYLTLDYYLDIEYKYDQAKEPVKFTLIFDSERIEISKGGYYTPARLGGTPETDREAEGEAYFTNIDWGDIKVTMLTPNGDEIEFTALKRAPSDIVISFIREYCEDYIVSNTIDIEDRRGKITSTSPYCS